jgi:hypothetical protein
VNPYVSKTKRMIGSFGLPPGAPAALIREQNRTNPNGSHKRQSLPGSFVAGTRFTVHSTIINCEKHLFSSLFSTFRKKLDYSRSLFYLSPILKGPNGLTVLKMSETWSPTAHASGMLMTEPRLRCWFFRVPRTT